MIRPAELAHMMLLAVTVTGFYDAGPFELAVESLPDGILIAALDGTIVFVNRGVERLFGWARADLLGQPVERLLPDALRDVHAVHRTAFARAPQARMMGPGRELIGRRRDGSTLRIEVLLSPVHTAAGQFVVASIADVGERHEHVNRHEEMLAGRRAFERAAATLSNVFLTVAAGQLDAVIAEALEQVTVALGIDRASFHQLRSDRVLEAPLEWDALGRPAPSISLANSERFPWTLRECLHGQTVAFAALDQLTHAVDRTAFAHRLTQAAVVVPLLAGGRVSGVFMVESSRPLRSWTPEARHRIDLFASVLGQALSRRAHEAALARAIADADQLTRNLVDVPHQEKQEKTEPAAAPERSHIVGESPASRRVLEQIHQVAATDATVLLLGETGTGKSLFASYIHDLSARGRKPMVALSCAAIPDTLIESELFGREKGAFTDAVSRQIGRFEVADHSTLFLDEIGELPAEVQVNCSASWRSDRSSGSGVRREFPWTCGSSRQHIAISRNGWSRLPFARTCSIGSMSFLFAYRRCANASKTFPSWCGTSSSSTARRSPSGSTRFPAKAWRRCSSMPGREIFASFATSWSAR
jgi:PAS domain S-box-containing protein